MDEKTRVKLTEAFQYCQSAEARRAFRKILGTALQLGCEIRWIPRKKEHRFRIAAPGLKRTLAVRRDFISIYSKSFEPLRVKDPDAATPQVVFGKAARKAFGPKARNY